MTNNSRDEKNSMIGFTAQLEDLGLILARNTLKVNESQIVDTPSTCKFHCCAKISIN